MTIKYYRLTVKNFTFFPLVLHSWWIHILNELYQCNTGTHQYHDSFASVTDISAFFSSLFSWAEVTFVFVSLRVISNLQVSREPKHQKTLFFILLRERNRNKYISSTPVKCYDYNMNYIVIRGDKNFTPHSATRLKEIEEKLKKIALTGTPYHFHGQEKTTNYEKKIDFRITSLCYTA